MFIGSTFAGSLPAYAVAAAAADEAAFKMAVGKAAHIRQLWENVARLRPLS